jgi:RNA polymerase primary sigma factor
MSNKTAVDQYMKDLTDSPSRGNTAEQELILKHLPWVISIAKGYRNQGLSFEDLIAEGNLGLIKAAKRYDPASGAFTTYSIHWIRQTIFLALSFNRTVRLPLSQIQKRAYHSGSYDQERNLELDKPIFDSGKTVADTFHTDCEYEKLDSQEHNASTSSEMLSTLPDRDRKIIEMHFGIGTGMPLSSDVIGLRMGLSSTRINQIVRAGINKMKEELV